MLAVFSKEFKAYFNSATGYVFMGVFLLICGIFFANYNLVPASPLYSNVLSSMTFIFLILVPVITMRLLAEEKHNKTDQLLLTSPLSIGEIVVGKYLASVALFFLTLMITFLFPFILSWYGSIPAGEIAAVYIGFALLGAAFISVGIFVSSLTENQVVSAVASFGVLLFIWIIDWIQLGFPVSSNAGLIFAGIILASIVMIFYMSTKNIIISAFGLLIGAIAVLVIFLKKPVLFEGFIPKFFGWFSLLSRFNNFGMGIVDLSSIVYYVTFTAAFIYLTVRIIEKRRWS
jgi:ABC-2 type transport system permease protein